MVYLIVLGVFGATIVAFLDDILILINELLYFLNLLTDGFGNIVDTLTYFVSLLHPMIVIVLAVAIIFLFLRKIFGLGSQ